MVTVYTITYNEELLIQFMIDHYRERFPGCGIVVYDNMSTDDTVKIARRNGCEVISYDTHGQLQDSRFIQIKNSCWKRAKTDWVLVGDLDELLDITTAQLRQEDALGTTIIKATGYNMVTLDDNLDLAAIKYGERDEGEDKCCLFNKKFIKEINYDIGCHTCNPVGTVKYNQRPYNLYNYCYINYDASVKKYREYGARLSPENIANGWICYQETPEEIRDVYTRAWEKAVKVR